MARNRLLRWIVILAIAAGQAPAGAGPVARPAGASAVTHFVNSALAGGPVAYWPFDDNSASTARDLAGNNNLTLHSGAALGSGPLPPITGQNLRVLNLNGSSGYAD